MSKIIVEEALSIEDVVYCIKLLLEAQKEMGFPTPEADIDKMYATLISPGCKTFITKVEDTGEITGLSSVIVDSVWFSQGIFLSSLALYVAPKYRKTLSFLKLLRKTKDFATIVGVPLAVGYLSDQDSERKEKLFKLYGFRKLGATFGSIA